MRQALQIQCGRTRQFCCGDVVSHVNASDGHGLGNISGSSSALGQVDVLVTDLFPLSTSIDVLFTIILHDDNVTRSRLFGQSISIVRSDCIQVRSIRFLTTGNNTSEVHCTLYTTDLFGDVISDCFRCSDVSAFRIESGFYVFVYRRTKRLYKCAKIRVLKPEYFRTKSKFLQSLSVSITRGQSHNLKSPFL